MPINNYGEHVIVHENLNITPIDTDWIRPLDWLDIPTIAEGEEVVYLLCKINNDKSNFIAFLFKGNYTVDWGDGTIENVNSNVKAQRNIEYENVEGTTVGGWKQTLIKITPQAGQTLNYVNINQLYTGVSAEKSSKFIDVVMNVPNVSGATNLYIGNSTNVYHFAVERIWIKEIGAITNMFQMFLNCYSLQSVPLFNTASVTSMQQMFQSCYSLKSVPLFNTVSVTSMYLMFYNCYTLQTVPLFNTVSVTSMSLMFYACYSIKSVPLFNTASVVNMQQMFYNCYTLQTVPLFNTALVTNMQLMFYNCNSLQYVPLFNTASITSMYQMFFACYSLKSVPLFNTASVTYMQQTFLLCTNLSKCEMVPINCNISFENCLLNYEEINNIFTNLPSRIGLDVLTITITGNIGASNALTDRTIAQNKNWSVIG